MMVTRTWRLLGTTLAVAVLAGCGAAATPGAGSAADAPSTASPSATSGSEVTAYLLETPEFSVGFPEEPTEEIQDITGSPGLTAQTYSVDLGTYSMAVGITDLPADLPVDDPIDVLERVRDGAVSGVPEGRELSSAPTTVDGRPALDFAAAVIDDGSYRSRIVLDGRRLYQVITAGAEDRQAEHDEFAASLRLRP